MKKIPTHRSLLARVLFGCVLLFGVARVFAGEVTPLSQADRAKVEALLSKTLKGKPTVLGGSKEAVDGGWRITCSATVGSGGDFDFVVMSEQSMTLGYIDSQKPKAEASKAAAKSDTPAKK